ncbi:MAG TPA: DUF1499 domain-containing protein [Alphaproteobacteria bacterium]|nr:DUF1499 domain-containing protein [Alphaproteobacteria bacterium]
MRRDGPKSLISKIGLGLALAAALGAVAAGYGNGAHWWSYRVALTALPWAAALGLAGAAVSLAGLLWRRRRGSKRRAIVYALLGLLLGLTMAGYPYSMRVIAGHVPPIHDITTDTANPPQFVALVPLREAAGATSPAAYDGPATARLQLEAYPDIKPALYAASESQVFEAALATAKSMGWQIVASVPAEGRIEAIATTFWFHFKDDVVIRIETERNAPSVGPGLVTRVDIRSKSRVGRSDLGTNAARIKRFLLALDRRMTGR